jgi:hypothetical protein
MPLDYAKLKNRVFPTLTQRYTARDTILYALGVGAGLEDPLDPDELRFVYEEGLRALPTMAVVLANEGMWLRDPQYGVLWKQLLHGEQMLQVHRPLAAEGTVVGTSAVEEIYDKGADKGAILYQRSELRDAQTGELLVSLRRSAFLRGDGGFGGKSEGAPRPHPVPADRAPDLSLALPTRPEQALLYRRRQPAARPALDRARRRLSEADPARPLHLRHRRTRDPAAALRQRSGAAAAPGRALLGAGLPRRHAAHRGLPHRADLGGLPLHRRRARGHRARQRPRRVQLTVAGIRDGKSGTTILNHTKLMGRAGFTDIIGPFDSLRQLAGTSWKVGDLQIRSNR